MYEKQLFDLLESTHQTTVSVETGDRAQIVPGLSVVGSLSPPETDLGAHKTGTKRRASRQRGPCSLAKAYMSRLAVPTGGSSSRVNTRADLQADDASRCPLSIEVRGCSEASSSAEPVGSSTRRAFLAAPCSSGLESAGRLRAIAVDPAAMSGVSKSRVVEVTTSSANSSAESVAAEEGPKSSSEGAPRTEERNPTLLGLPVAL